MKPVTRILNASFEWPDSSAEDFGERVFCHGLGDHFAILCDGRVVPCCLDREAAIDLGNVFDTSLWDILGSDRVKAIKDGFLCKEAREDLCRRCSYARRFKI